MTPMTALFLLCYSNENAYIDIGDADTSTLIHKHLPEIVA